jgi:CubicO group peptidase (beta-lactamase class C family)
VGGFGLELSARNLAKFGLLYLNGGVWEGEQLIPADFIAEATSYQATGDSTGGASYGYQWWISEPQGIPAYFALGYVGQYVYVVPSRDLVVVVIKGFEDPPEIIGAPRPMIENVVLSAALPQEPVG